MDELATIHFLQEEQKRLENLKFWDEVPELKDKPKVWHFHPMAFVEYANAFWPYYVDKDGFIQGVDIVKHEISNLGRGDLLGPNAIILHRTASRGFTENVLNWWKNPQNTDNVGAHFVIDKDGTITQVVSLKKYANHVGRIRPRCAKDNTCPASYANLGNAAKHTEELKKEYPNRYPYNRDSIGIEVVAFWDKDTALWDEATPQQLESVKKVVQILQQEYNLNDEDLYQHQCIAYKTSGEGKNLYPPADSNSNVDSQWY